MNRPRSPIETLIYALEFLFWVGLAFLARRVFEDAFPPVIVFGSTSVQSIYIVFPLIVLLLVAGYAVSDRWLRRWLVRRGWLKAPRS